MGLFCQCKERNKKVNQILLCCLFGKDLFILKSTIVGILVTSRLIIFQRALDSSYSFSVFKYNTLSHN